MRRLAVIFALLAAASAYALDTSLPPLGKRVYIIENSNLFRPTPIKRDSVEPRAPFLRDPIQPSDKRPEPVVSAPIPRRQKTQLTETGKLRFRTTPIGGKLSNPRVEFQQELLEIGRADESESIDFVSRIYDTASQLETQEGTP